MKRAAIDDDDSVAFQPPQKKYRSGPMTVTERLMLGSRDNIWKMKEALRNKREKAKSKVRTKSNAPWKASHWDVLTAATNSAAKANPVIAPKQAPEEDKEDAKDTSEEECEVLGSIPPGLAAIISDSSASQLEETPADFLKTASAVIKLKVQEICCF
jgi:hypothetical protein